MKDFLVCPVCKKNLIRLENSYSCDDCHHSYHEVKGIPVFLPQNEERFKQLEREYWDQRFAGEGDLSGLQALYERPDFLSDEWGILEYMKRIVREFPDSATLLEIGAGVGSQAIPLALSYNYSTVITDISVASLDLNRQAVSSLSLESNIEYYAVDGDYLPFQDNTFDIVLTHATLHHLPTPQKTVSEMARCVRPGGLLVLGHEPNRRIFEPLRMVADRLHITEKYTQRFVEGSYSVADEETPGFFGHELRRWMAENRLSIEWITPIWFLTAISYNLPVVINMLFSSNVATPERLRRLGLMVDEKILAKTPVVRNLGLFWSLGARKME